LFATTEELEKDRSRIQSMEEEVEKAKADALTGSESVALVTEQINNML
jgi:hypothetical protein